MGQAGHVHRAELPAGDVAPRDVRGRPGGVVLVLEGEVEPGGRHVRSIKGGKLKRISALERFWWRPKSQI